MRNARWSDRRKRRRALPAAAMAFALAAALAACRPGKPEETEALPVQTEAEEEKTSAQGNPGSMVEADGRLYLKQGDAIYAIEKETGEMKVLRRFSEGEKNGAFWVLGDSLYFDVSQPGTGKGTTERSELYSLCRLDLTSGEEEHLADLMSQPFDMYAADGKLYIRSMQDTVIYSLDDQGKTVGELAPPETIYGQIPEGCTELFGGVLPRYVDQLGYMPVQNDTCLVIAKADGTNARPVEEITNTSSVLFAEDVFFALFRDGNGKTQVQRYDLETCSGTPLFETDENPSLLQVLDGYLYYVVPYRAGEGKQDESGSGGAVFYRIPWDGSGDPEEILTVAEEPGLTGEFTNYGNFFVTGETIYCQAFSGYETYMGVTELSEPRETRLLEPALFASPLEGVGHVEAVRETISCPCGEYTAGEIYTERLVLDGDDEGTQAVNAWLEERQQAVLAAGREKAAQTDEAWVHESGEPAYVLTDLFCGRTGVCYLDEHVLCIRLDSDEYAGGAHGNPLREYVVFDRKTGARLTLSDIVATPQEKLQEMVGKAFGRLARETSFSFESPEDLEHTVSDGLSYESPFYLSDEGVVFYYEPYVIAPYSEGFPEVTIPYGDLELRFPLGEGV